MNLCDDDHQEVCYEGRDCPACIIKHELAVSEDENKELKGKMEELEDEIKGLKEEAL